MEENVRKAVLAAMKEAAPLDWAKANEIADRFKVKARAVTAMASRNDIEYNRKVRASKDGSAIVSKADLVKGIAGKLGVEVDKLDGLDKANKAALETVFNAL